MYELHAIIGASTTPDPIRPKGREVAIVSPIGPGERVEIADSDSYVNDFLACRRLLQPTNRDRGVGGIVDCTHNNKTAGYQ
jgi:hypothetical protein